MDSPSHQRDPLTQRRVRFEETQGVMLLAQSAAVPPRSALTFRNSQLAIVAAMQAVVAWWGCCRLPWLGDSKSVTIEWCLSLKCDVLRWSAATTMRLIHAVTCALACSSSISSENLVEMGPESVRYRISNWLPGINSPLAYQL